MRNLISEQESGSKTVDKFCRRHKISTNKFYYWKKKLKTDRPNESGHANAATEPAAPFFPVTFPAIDKMTATEKIELYFPSGLRASLPVSSSPAAIKTILELCGY
jgi:hypothetical protein